MITSVADATWSCFYLDVFDVRNCSPSEEPCVFKIVKASHVRRAIDTHNVKVANKSAKKTDKEKPPSVPESIYSKAFKTLNSVLPARPSKKQYGGISAQVEPSVLKKSKAMPGAVLPEEMIVEIDVEGSECSSDSNINAEVDLVAEVDIAENMKSGLVPPPKAKPRSVPKSAAAKAKRRPHDGAQIRP